MWSEGDGGLWSTCEEKQTFHLQSLLQEVVASFQAVVVFVGVTPVADQEHQRLKHKDWTIKGPVCKILKEVRYSTKPAWQLYSGLVHPQMCLKAVRSDFANLNIINQATFETLDI